MDDVAETELHEATAGLGNWHQVGDKPQYLVNREECISCMRDLQIALKHDVAETGHVIRLKLGEWKVLPNHLVPLFTSYREDSDISSLVLKVLVQLTTRCDLYGAEQLRHLEHLQDYKEAFAKKDVFIILMGMLVENMEEDEEGGERKESGAEVFAAVLSLLRNLVSVPDPGPGDAGFTPMRRGLQMVYIRNFHDEGVLDFFLLFGEGLSSEEDSEKKAWALADIVYHICTHVDPESLTQGTKEKDKSALRELIAREHVDTRLRTPLSSRHKGFGTAIQSRTAQGGSSIATSVMESADVSKGGTLWRREFKDPNARNEKKLNMFHDPFFVDLEEGSVRDHNQLNTHLKNSLEGAKAPLDAAVVAGLRKFFEEFMQTCFSSLVHILRSTLGAPRSAGQPHLARRAGDPEEKEQPGGPFDRPKLLNFLSWFLEFHRHHHAAAVSKAKKAKEEIPVIDIAAVQGAIDLDMIQFTAARLKEYGKDSMIHVSMLVVALRTLAQQVKTIDIVVDSKDQDTRDCGEILTQNIIKDDVMANCAWVMKNFKTSSHDPRILSYAVEVYHYMLRLMKLLSERKGQKLEFQVERTSARFVRRAITTMEQEIAALAEAKVIENLFHLLEKYKRHSAQLNSMLVKLIYQMIRVRRENIVVFFELSYFSRIQRIYADPVVRDRRSGKRYQEMMELLKFILRQFFKCAETNHCAFVELLFRKVPENSKDNLLESHTAEFAAILDNYENEEYARVLENMRAGETLKTLKTRQQAMQQGTLPWTEQEDELLRTRYPIYAMHPLCAELLAAELPEDTHRTGAKVRKRLIELGLIVSVQRGGAGRGQPGANENREEPAAGGAVDPFEPPLKKPRLDGEDGTAAGGADEADDTMLEMDLERLLDEAMDAENSLNFPETQPDSATQINFPETQPDSAMHTAAPSARVAASAPAAPAASASAGGGGAGDEEMDLEAELEAQLDKDLFCSPEKLPASAGAAASQAAKSASAAADEAFGSQPDALERSLESLLGSPPAEALGSQPDALERALEALLEQAPDLLESVPEAQASASAPASAPCGGGGASGASQHDTVTASRASHGGSSTASGFDLEQALESQLEKDPFFQQTQGESQASRRLSSGSNFDLEGALGSQLDKDPDLFASPKADCSESAAAAPAASQGDLGASATQDIDLEQALESLLDEDPDLE